MIGKNAGQRDALALAVAGEQLIEFGLDPGVGLVDRPRCSGTSGAERRVEERRAAVDGRRPATALPSGIAHSPTVGVARTSSTGRSISARSWSNA